MTRREFIDAEAEAVLQMEADGAISWDGAFVDSRCTHRIYHCDCGFTTSSAGAIYDHCLSCGRGEQLCLEVTG